jgi:uncharacterized protein YjbJ (UPF0337 family)
MNHDKGPIWNQIAGNWKKFTGHVREQWGDLTDDEIMEINGKREKLAGKIQERYGIGQEEANRQIDEWSNRLKF